MDWLREHPRLAAAAAAAVLVLGVLVLRSRDNSWRITNASPRGTAIVAFGDSLTAGYQVPEADSYPAQLSRRIGRPILNRGISGNTAAEGLARLEKDVLSEDPRVVLLALGANDMLRKESIDGAFGALQTIVRRLHERGTLVILIGVEGYPMIHGDWGGRYRALARESGCVYVPDMLDDVLGHPDLMYDQIHPNGAGYAKIAARIESVAGDHLKR